MAANQNLIKVFSYALQKEETGKSFFLRAGGPEERIGSASEIWLIPRKRKNFTNGHRP